MTRFLDDHVSVFAGYGFDEKGRPYLSINDIDAAKCMRYPVLGKTFSLRRLPRRRCVGRFDLVTGEAQVCPMALELPPDTKDDMCPACQEATGFNPSFYHADFVSPQQRAYNLTPHYVYLAYFSPIHLKAGISAEVRGIRRLLDQGARAARVVGRFPDAYEARDLEAALCAQQGVSETMRQGKKMELLANERYGFTEASDVLDAAVARLTAVEIVQRAGFDASEPALDLSPYYFGGPSPACNDLQIPNGDSSVCGGCCVGMVGGALVFEQGGMNFLVSLKDWQSREVDLLEDEVACTYDFAPQQMSLL